MSEQKRMSVADILATCRQIDSEGGEAAAPTAGESKPAVAPKPAAPSPKPAAQGGGRPSVQEMLARARAEKQAEPAAPAAQASNGDSPSGAPKAKPAAAAVKAKPAPAAKPSGPQDTASILAAARGQSKPGPITKAEAAARGPVAPPAKPAKPSLVLPPMPVKPAYAKPAPTKAAGKAGVNEGRRLAIFSVLVGSFLALGFSALTATMGMWTLGLARFMFPNILREPPSQFTVGFPSAFAPGVVETKFIPEYGVWVVNDEYNGQQQIFALVAVCTHLGCTPNWLEAEQKFKCPCHGSGFYKDGINFEGPAPRPLERYAIAIGDDGQLQIDKSRTFQQEMGGWEDPTSFVAV